MDSPAPSACRNCWMLDFKLAPQRSHFEKSVNFPMEKVELYNWKCGNIAFSHVWTYSVYVYLCNLHIFFMAKFTAHKQVNYGKLSVSRPFSIATLSTEGHFQ